MLFKIEGSLFLWYTSVMKEGEWVCLGTALKHIDLNETCLCQNWQKKQGWLNLI
jgi:hypothetical protein